MSENISTLHPNPDEPTVHGPLWQHGTAAGACRCSIDEPRLRKIDPNPKNPDDIVPDNAPTRGSEPRADISSLQREFRPSQLMPSSVIGRSPASLNTTLPVREKKKSNLPCSSGPPRASPSIKPKRNVLFHDGDQTTDQTTELLLEDQLATNQDEWEVKHSVPLVEGESFEQGKASEGNKSFEDHKASGERKYEENADKEFEKEKPKGGSDFEGSTEFDVKAKVHENKGKAISRYPLGPDPGPSNSHKHAQLESRGQIADQKKHYYVEPSSIKSDTASLNNSSAALITNKGISNPKHDVTPLHEFFRKEIHRGLNLKHEVSPQREIRSAHEVTPMRAISLIHGASHVIEKVDGAENISKGDERIDEDKHIGSSPSCYDLNSDASVVGTMRPRAEFSHDTVLLRLRASFKGKELPVKQEESNPKIYAASPSIVSPNLGLTTLARTIVKPNIDRKSLCSRCLDLNRKIRPKSPQPKRKTNLISILNIEIKNCRPGQCKTTSYPWSRSRSCCGSGLIL